MAKRIWGLVVGVALAVTLSLGAVPALAQNSNTVGDWYYSASGDLSEADTASSSGATFGMLCSRSLTNCVFYIRSDSTCDVGAQVPVLENAPNGAFQLTGTCQVIPAASGQIDALTLGPRKALESSLGADGVVGFAVPMDSGAFRVYRFSTNGALPAIYAVAHYASQPVGDQVQ